MHNDFTGHCRHAASAWPHLPAPSSNPDSRDRSGHLSPFRMVDLRVALPRTPGDGTNMPKPHPSHRATNMNFPADYTPPTVWKWETENGGEFAKINRPIAGPTHDKVLPVGKHPIQLYSLATPNGVKVTVMLEELLAARHHRRRI